MLPSHAIKQLLVFRVMLQPLLVCFQSFIIFFHKKLSSPFSGIPFRKGWIKLNALLRILQSLRQCAQFCVACSSVTVRLKGRRQLSSISNYVRPPITELYTCKHTGASRGKWISAGCRMVCKGKSSRIWNVDTVYKLITRKDRDRDHKERLKECGHNVELEKRHEM